MKIQEGDKVIFKRDVERSHEFTIKDGHTGVVNSMAYREDKLDFLSVKLDKPFSAGTNFCVWTHPKPNEIEEDLAVLTKEGLVPVNECIRYIESCGWKLTTKSRGFYCFENPHATISFRTFNFTLKQLRETYKNGW